MIVRHLNRNRIAYLGSGPSSRRFQETGFSLVELMVAIAIGSFIALVMSSLFSNISLGYRTMDDSGRASENGAFALRMLADDLRMAGFIGYAHDTGRTPNCRVRI